MKQIILVLFFLNFFLGFHCQKIDKLTVAVSANAQFVFKKIKKAYILKKNMEKDLKQKKKNQFQNLDIETVVGSSGKLTALIEAKAPFDIFLSADMKYPQYLYKKKIISSKPKIYVKGILVLWVEKKIFFQTKIGLRALSKKGASLSYYENFLFDKRVKKIAIANPKLAPYGRAAIEYLKNNKLYKRIKHKLVYASSISQVGSYILTGAVELAFVSKSVLMSKSFLKKNSFLELPINDYSTVNQGAVIIQNRKNLRILAQDFYKFIFSKEAQLIFEKNGYRID